MKKIIMFLLALFVTTLAADAQFNIKDKVKSNATNRAEQRVDEGIDKGIDKIEEGIGSIFKKKEKKNEVQNEEQNSDYQEKIEEAPVQQTATKVNKQDLLSYNKFDFVPGNDIIFEDDLKGEQKGEFPSKWNLLEGNAEIAEVNGENVIALVGFTYIEPLFKNSNDKYLPDDFTLEFDVYNDGNEGENSIEFLNSNNQTILSSLFWKDSERFLISWDLTSNEKNSEDKFDNSQGWHHYALSFNKRALKVYMDAKRVANIPNIAEKPAKVKFFARGSEDSSAFHIKNIRIAKGAVPLYDKYLTDGKIVTYGITFDIGKATLKPESMGTLNEIFALMKNHAELKFSVEGHTDNTGNAASNQTLSDARAKSVVEKLVEMGVDRSRLASKGHGQSKPIDDNNTPEGRAKNRRVEFVKL